MGLIKLCMVFLFVGCAMAISHRHDHSEEPSTRPAVPREDAVMPSWEDTFPYPSQVDRHPFPAYFYYNGQGEELQQPRFRRDVPWPTFPEGMSWEARGRRIGDFFREQRARRRNYARWLRLNRG